MADNSINCETTPESLEYLKLLRREYPTIREASAHLIHLKAILQLPKGTEHFLSDLHGEHGAFLHMLHNASGVIKQKINALYCDMLPAHERDMLCTLIYYPEEKLSLLKRQSASQQWAFELDSEWYRITILRLVNVCRAVSVKYTRKRVREAMPADFGGLLEELLLRDDAPDKATYYNELLDSIIFAGQSDAFIIALSRLIQYLAVDRLHIIGDIYDRGPRADLILDALMLYHTVDVQWGNHDIVWMGAAARSEACIAQVIVTSLKYGNLDTLEMGYGISLRALSEFAARVYEHDPCEAFLPKANGDGVAEDQLLIARMHKAIAVVQFKLEGQIIKRHTEYHMQERRLLDKINYAKCTITLGDKVYPMRSCQFPTISPDRPYELTEQETELMDRLINAFAHSEKLQRHASFLYSAGSMYLTCNGNLLYHGCIPLTPEGEFAELPLPDMHGDMPRGRAALEKAERYARQGFFAHRGSKAKQDGQDFLWYLGCGPYSPLFGKERMTTFERYFIEDRDTWHEEKNAYYKALDDELTACRILEEFGLDPHTGHIINGHVPVKVMHGESPVKAGGRLLVIDGGLSRAYQSVTGIAGYTLIFNSHALLLVAHQPFESTQQAITQEQDIHSVQSVVQLMPQRLLIADTDQGRSLSRQIAALEKLLEAYRSGLLKEGAHDEHII